VQRLDDVLGQVALLVGLRGIPVGDLGNRLRPFGKLGGLHLFRGRHAAFLQLVVV
jgi:hypothetical protein